MKWDRGRIIHSQHSLGSYFQQTYQWPLTQIMDGDNLKNFEIVCKQFGRAKINRIWRNLH